MIWDDAGGVLQANRPEDVRKAPSINALNEQITGSATGFLACRRYIREVELDDDLKVPLVELSFCDDARR